MATAVPVLPAAQAKALADAYKSAVAARRQRTLLVLAIVVVLVFVSAQLAHVRPLTLIANIGNFANLSGLDKKPLTVKGKVFPPASSGNGLHGIPGSMLSSDRFVRAALFVLNTPTAVSTDVQRSRAWHIMNNFDIPYGSIYLEASSGYGGGANAYEFTEWTVVADLKNRTYHIRSFENPQIMTLDFKKFDVNGKTVINTPLLK